MATRDVPTDLAATREEIAAAFAALTPQQRTRLLAHARWRLRCHRAWSLGRTADDLLQEALAATLEGRRRWPKATVDFAGHLYGVLRSLASHWTVETAHAGADLESDVPHRVLPDGDVVHPMHQVAAPAVDDERRLAARQQLAALTAAVRADPVLRSLLTALGEHPTSTAACAALGLTPEAYAAAIRRLRYKARALFVTPENDHG